MLRNIIGAVVLLVLGIAIFLFARSRMQQGPTGTPQPPVAVISANPTEGIGPLTVKFSAKGSRDPDGGKVTHTWDFADGSAPRHERDSEHTFGAVTVDTVHTITLEVTDNEDEKATDTVAITVKAAVTTPPPPGVNQPPVAGFTWTQLLVATRTIEFVSTATDPEKGTLTITWDFGDGNKGGDLARVTNQYTAAGTFTVTQTVTDKGASAFTSKTVTVVDKPAPPQPLTPPTGDVTEQQLQDALKAAEEAVSRTAR